MPGTLFQQGLAAHRDGRIEDAVAAYTAALRTAPSYAAAYNLGVILSDRFQWAEALEALAVAERMRPGETPVLVAAGGVLTRLHRPSEGERLLRIVLEREPAHDLARYRLACARLMQGRYAEAWPLWESRPSRRESPLSALSFPEWKGEPLAEKSILVWGEQGIGDEIQAARFIPMLRALGCARITLACRPENIRLFQPLGADSIVDRTTRVDVPPHDYWIHIWSLPGPLGVTLEGLSGRPYLNSPAVKAVGGVGLALSGNPKNPNDHLRSIADDEFAARIPDAVALEPAGDTLDSLAQIAALDLVITVDTSWAHMAAATGKPCWLLLSHGGVDWRWFPKGERSPWYDSVRCFWQSQPGDWRGVVTDVLAALRGRDPASLIAPECDPPANSAPDR